MKTIKLVMEFDGSGFSGWQAQPGLRTVQTELERAIKSLTGEELRVVGAGRTDAGVHALGQVVSFRTESRRESEVFRRGLNALLGEDAAILSAEEAPPDFDAQRSAVGKWYRYLIREGRNKVALERGRVWRLGYALELEAMRAGASHLIGEHDFSSFRSSTCDAKTSARRMKRIEIFRNGQGRLVVELWAEGFLKQMARAMVGTLVEVGRGKCRPDEIKSILEARDRTRAGPTAPAQGLYLARVDY